MPSPMFNVAQLSQSIQYTGSNSADIVSQVPGLSFVTEVSGTLTVNFNGQYNIVLATTDWVVFNPSSTFGLSNTTYLGDGWNCMVVCPELETLAGQLETVASASAVRAMGTAPVPTLLLGQDTTVAVQIQPAMPDSGYSAYAVTFGGVNLADLDITSVSVVDVDTVNVAVDNGGLGTVSGVTLMVHAVD